MAENNYQGFWGETLNQLRTDLGEEEFNAWFTDISYVRSEENSIVIGFPSGFHRDRVKTRYLNSIKTKLNTFAKREIGIDLEVIKNDNPKEAPLARKTSAGTPPQTNTTSPDTGKDENLPQNTDTSHEKPKKQQHSQMKEDYNFDRFIIGENNNFAGNAAKAISRNPGTNYNPFFIYGGVGMGKTHLMQAIGNYIHENSEKKVIYITSEDFLNEYVEYLRENKMNLFKNKFRRVDVLLIDDIQFFANRPGVQGELFYTFNAMLSAKNQIVFTCDRPPMELKKFEERLVSRFNQSLQVDLQPPRYEERCAILKDFAENRKAIIPNEVIDLISKNISSNVRDLKGALEKLISYTEIMRQPITLEIAKDKLRDYLVSSRQANLSIEIIQKAVADFFSSSISDLKGKKRNQKVVYPRQLAMFLCRQLTDYSTTEIGEAFGGRDHTTVMHSTDKIDGLLLTDPTLDSTIESLKRQIKDLSAKS